MPKFLSADVEIEVPNYGKITVDIGYGGAFYALLPAQQFGLDVKSSKTSDLVNVASTVSGECQSWE